MKRALLLAMLLTGTVHAADKLKSGVFEPPRMAPEFSLAGSNGGELDLRSYRGKVVALGFGFSHCPEICPTTLATLAKARQRVGAAAKDFQVVYVTVDPERDSPERLRTYLTNFDPSFVGGTGSEAALAAVRREYGIAAERSEAGYGFNHSSYTYLVDRAGNLRALMPYGHPAEDYVHDLQLLLRP